MEKIVIRPGEENRLDRFLADRFTQWSRTYFKHLINAGAIQIDQKKVNPHHKLRVGQTVQIKWPREERGVEAVVVKELPFDILFEDRAFLVLNKPPDLLVHPARPTKKETTISQMLQSHLGKGECPEDVRPGLVHRLDRDTSGVLIFAKTPRAHKHLSLQFSERKVKKTYFGLVKGVPTIKAGSLEGRIARHPKKRLQYTISTLGRPSTTHFKVKEKFKSKASYLELKPLTGRTHQIRVHVASFKHPILGDRVYGGSQGEFPFISRQMLHAGKIEFEHPISLKKVFFEAPLPDDFQKAIKRLRSL